MNKFILSFLSLTILAACQKPGQDAPSSPQAPKTPVMGPSDGGGGDTCNGKMIESYRVDVAELDEFKEYIAPLLRQIVAPSQDKSSKSASPFLLSPKMKNWYLIDCKLQDIPKERKGLYLETYQTALHTSREIFIDSTSFNSMAKEEKAKLLLHEMVMSYYLMKYLSIEELCKISGNCSGDFSVASKWKMFRPETYRPLNEADHQKIREVTAWLWSQRSSLSPEAFAQVLKNNDFDRRFERTSIAETPASREIEVDPKVLVRMFKKHQWAKTFPKFCQFDPASMISQSACQVELLADIQDSDFPNGAKMKALELKLKILRQSDQQAFEQEFIYPLALQNQKLRLHVNKLGNVLNAAPFMMTSQVYGNFKVVEGTKAHSLMFMLNFHDPENPEIYQLILHAYRWYSIETELVQRDGATYRETYGYLTPIEEESENLFIENELPFTLKTSLSGKVFIYSVLTAN